MKLLKWICSSRANKVLKRTEQNLLDGDIVLVSYPRSGNTWVRFLFANLLKQEAAKEINFHNVHQYCQELESQDEQSDTSFCKPRILKSHQSYNSSFPRVIYIVRDCRDVYVSYYYYVKNTIPATWSFKDFIKMYDFPYGYWNQHVNSWVNSNFKNKSNFKIILYEDLLENTLSTFSEMVAFSELESTPTQIKRAVENSSFSTMKTIEKKYGRRFGGLDGVESFVRVGKSKQWMSYFGSEELEILASRKEFETLKYLGYSV